MLVLASPMLRGSASATPDSLEDPLPLEAAPAVTTPLIPVPDGCSVPEAPDAVFAGELAANSAAKARFQVLGVRAGDLGAALRGSYVDVAYPDLETRFLRVGERYLVGVTFRAETPWSKVRATAPDFGGHAVIGIESSEGTCPALRDAILTLRPDGSSLDTGVLSPLRSAKWQLLRAVTVPVAVGLALLVIAVVVRHLLAATARSLRDLVDDASG